MKNWSNYFFFIILVQTIIFKHKAQCPLNSIDLLSQNEINSFPINYPGCSYLPDGVNLKISGSDISNLTPLSQLNGSNGIIEIRNCPQLSSLIGLDQLRKIGNDLLDGFILRDLPSLTSIAVFTSLDTVYGEFTIRNCSSLTDLNGLDSLKYIDGSLIIRENSGLISLDGLNSLNYIGETLELVGNPVLGNITSLNNIDTITGGIEGGLFIEGNNSLSSLEGLGNPSTFIGSNLDLILNGQLSFCSVPAICNYFQNPPIGSIITINGNVTGCNNTLEIENSCQTVSLNEINSKSIVFYLQSNIADDQLIIETNQYDLKITIINTLCKSDELLLQKGINVIDVGKFYSGMYYIKYADNKFIKWVKP